MSETIRMSPLLCPVTNGQASSRKHARGHQDGEQRVSCLWRPTRAYVVCVKHGDPLVSTDMHVRSRTEASPRVHPPMVAQPLVALVQAARQPPCKTRATGELVARAGDNVPKAVCDDATQARWCRPPPSTRGRSRASTARGLAVAWTQGQQRMGKKKSAAVQLTVVHASGVRTPGALAFDLRPQGEGAQVLRSTAALSSGRCEGHSAPR